MYKLIVAYDLLGGLGYKNSLPWYEPKDLQRVKKLTTGKTIVMGRKTFESFKKPLPDRKTVVLTKDKNYKSEHKDVDIIHNIEDVKNYKDVFIFGGSTIYEEFLKRDLIDEMYITVIDKIYDCDVFFPSKYLDKFETVESIKNGDCLFIKQIKKKA